MPPHLPWFLGDTKRRPDVPGPTPGGQHPALRHPLGTPAPRSKKMTGVWRLRRGVGTLNNFGGPEQVGTEFGTLKNSHPQSVGPLVPLNQPEKGTEPQKTDTIPAESDPFGFSPAPFLFWCGGVSY